MNWHRADIASKYRAGEAITGPHAVHLIRQCGLDRADGSKELVVLDNACGTGVVTLTLYEELSPAAKEKLQAVAGDFSEGMVKSAQERIEENGWKGASAKLVDAQNTNLPSVYFTHVLTNFAIALMPDPRACISETFRILQPSGYAGWTIWKSAGWYPYAAAALASIPDTQPLPSFEALCAAFVQKKETPDESWLDMAFVEAQVRKAGFQDVKVVLYPSVYKQNSAEEFAKAFSGMALNILANVWSKEECARIAPHIESEFAKAMRAKFGDGEVTLEFESWCITAQKPEA